MKKRPGRYWQQVLLHSSKEKVFQELVHVSCFCRECCIKDSSAFENVFSFFQLQLQNLKVQVCLFLPSRCSRKVALGHSTFQNSPSAVYRHPLCRWAWNMFSEAAWVWEGRQQKVLLLLKRCQRGQFIWKLFLFLSLHSGLHNELVL